MTSAWKNLSTLPSKTHPVTVTKKPMTGSEDEICPRCKLAPEECDCHLCIDTLEDGEEMTPEQEEYVENVKTVASTRTICWDQFHAIKKIARGGLIEFFDTLTFQKLYAFLYGEAAEIEGELFSQK